MIATILFSFFFKMTRSIYPTHVESIEPTRLVPGPRHSRKERGVPAHVCQRQMEAMFDTSMGDVASLPPS